MVKKLKKKTKKEDNKISEEVEGTFEEIKAMNIQGARNVALTAVNSLKVVKDKAELEKSVTYLKKARPTEPMMRNALNYILAQVEKGTGIDEAIQEFVDLAGEAVGKVADFGSRRIKDDDKILTFCHSSTVMAVLKKAWREGARFEVYAAETRPRYQGRSTAEELNSFGIPVTLIVDSAVRSLVNDMDLVLMGVDAITSDAHIINKVGASTVALCAHEARTSCGFASEIFKFDPMTAKGDLEPIERRYPEEVWKDPPEGVNVLNIAFDATSPEYIDFVVTEEGVFNAYDISNLARDKYPWMFLHK